MTSGSNVLPCTGSSRTGLSNGVWNLEIGPVVWEISGGGPFGPPPPPPAGRVTIQTPAGRGLRNWDLSFWTPVNFEVEYFINDETEGVLTDTVIYFSDQHLTWLSQLKPNAKVG